MKVVLMEQLGLLEEVVPGEKEWLRCVQIKHGGQ